MKSKFTRLSALFLSILLITALFAACGSSSEDEAGNVPVIDLELPATSSTEPVYVPGESDADPSGETTPSTEVDPSGETTTSGDTTPSTEADPSGETTPSTEEETAKAKTTNSVNLREEASTESTILVQLPKGAVVTLLDTSNSEWYKVSYNDKEGYVKAEYLDTNPSSTEMELKGKVTTNSLNIRDAASKDGKSIGALSKGDIVTITATENGWYKIKHGSGYGYVSADYVTVIED